MPCFPRSCAESKRRLPPQQNLWVIPDRFGRQVADKGQLRHCPAAGRRPSPSIPTRCVNFSQPLVISPSGPVAGDFRASIQDLIASRSCERWGSALSRTGRRWPLASTALDRICSNDQRDEADDFEASVAARTFKRVEVPDSFDQRRTGQGGTVACGGRRSPRRCPARRWLWRGGRGLYR